MASTYHHVQGCRNDSNFQDTLVLCEKAEMQHMRRPDLPFSYLRYRYVLDIVSIYDLPSLTLLF